MDLPNFQLQYSELTKKMYIYDRVTCKKKDVTNEFISIAINHFMNNNVTDGKVLYKMVPEEK